jgi:hypothetical protein
MHKNAMKCNETLSKWFKNKHGASKIIDTLETYHPPPPLRHALRPRLDPQGSMRPPSTDQPRCSASRCSASRQRPPLSDQARGSGWQHQQPDPYQAGGLGYAQQPDPC